MQHAAQKERKICVSIAEKYAQTAIGAARNVLKLADVIEIRLDSLQEPAVSPFTESISSPLLFTNRPVWEGGSYSGEEDDRIQLLLDAVENKVSYIDIELEAAKKQQQKIIDASRKTDTKVIVSWHNFQETPDYSQLGDILNRQRESGAHIGKIVTMAHDYSDVLRVLHLQILAHNMNFPLIAFCMGKAGMISRLATLELGGYMTYASPDLGEATAPGQIPVKNLLNALEQLHHGD